MNWTQQRRQLATLLARHISIRHDTASYSSLDWDTLVEEALTDWPSNQPDSAQQVLDSPDVFWARFVTQVKCLA